MISGQRPPVSGFERDRGHAPGGPPALPVPGFPARGNGGQFVFVIPSDDLVIVHLARMGSEADYAHRNGVEPG
jgi:rhodanese-related sulfurtransferase